MKKLTIEFIRAEFAKEGYILRSVKYFGAYSYLDVTCPNGHDWKTTWQKWSIGRRCKYCNKSRIWFKDLINEFKREKYLLLTKESEFVSSKKTKLKYRCNNGHFGEISVANWKNGSRCKICYLKRRTFQFEYVKKEIEKSGYKVLSDEQTYVNSRTKLKLKCDKGHIVYISWNGWKAGIRCKKCSLKERDAKARLKYDFIKKEFEKKGCILLSKSYNNAFGKLDYICKMGHRCSTRWNYFQQQCGCSICANINNSGSGNYNWQGGISKEPYCQNWTKKLKESIKERDGYKCMNPDCWCTNTRLTIHHIDYNKKNCNPNNLITVCNSCNIRANTDRSWYTKWYRAIMYRRYDYKY